MKTKDPMHATKKATKPRAGTNAVLVLVGGDSELAGL